MSLQPPSDTFDRQAGFTLVELLVALFIFGLLAAAGTSLLVFSSNAQAVTTTRLDDVASEQRVTTLLSSDLAQVVPRVSRDIGGNRISAFAGGETQQLLRYIRGGVQSSDDSERSGLQNIEIRLNGDRIERIVSPMIDGSSETRTQLLLSDVASVTMRFRRAGVWQSIWTSQDPAAVPQAVELNVTRRGRAPVTRLFLVGSGR